MTKGEKMDHRADALRYSRPKSLPAPKQMTAEMRRALLDAKVQGRLLLQQAQQVAQMQLSQLSMLTAAQQQAAQQQVPQMPLGGAPPMPTIGQIAQGFGPPLLPAPGFAFGPGPSEIKDAEPELRRKAEKADAFPSDELPGRGANYGYIVAWRIWILKYSAPNFNPDLIRLSSTAAPALWHPDKPMVASDSEMKGAEDGQLVGVHAFKRGVQAEMNVQGIGSVYGPVALWGKVVEHRHGYKAEYAYPLAVRVVGKLLTTQHLTKVYDLRYQVEEFEE